MNFFDEEKNPSSDYEFHLNENPTESIFQTDVAEHFQKYKLKIIENKDSNAVIKAVSIGDRVLIKKDFDMNLETKRLPFESFFENDTFIVVEMLSNNMIKLENTRTSENKTVYRGAIKKI